MVIFAVFFTLLIVVLLYIVRFYIKAAGNCKSTCSRIMPKALASVVLGGSGVRPVIYYF